MGKDQPAISGQERNLWYRLAHEASETAYLLPKCFDDPDDSDLERTTLVYAAGLAVDCVTVTHYGREEMSLLPLREKIIPAEVRWDIESSVQMAPRFSPWAMPELDVLRQNPPDYRSERELWLDTMGNRLPQLVQDWHRYMGERNLSGEKESASSKEVQEYGRVTLLAMTADRLASGVKELLVRTQGTY
jgi:hypothetical protein